MKAIAVIVLEILATLNSVSLLTGIFFSRLALPKLTKLFILFLLSFFLAGSEVAFFSLTTRDVNILKTRKQPSFKRIVTLLEQPKILLASIFIANCFVNIGIILISNLLIDGWFTEQLFSSHLLNFIVKVIAVSFFIVLFVEVLPKVWATHHKVWFAAVSSLIVEIFHSLLYRLSKRFVSLSDKIEKNISPSKTAGLDENNLDYAIDLLPENEASVEEKQILKGIRKFGVTSVKQIMRTRLDVSGIDATMRFPEIIKFGISIFPEKIAPEISR
jgi:CBS domain containing-hemolysin-like protein